MPAGRAKTLGFMMSFSLVVLGIYQMAELLAHTEISLIELTRPKAEKSNSAHSIVKTCSVKGHTQ